MSQQGSSVMKLYYDPISTSSRPLMMFAAEHRLPIDWVEVSLLQGEQNAAPFLAINPNGCVPVLDDNGFVLGECSAILKYLADLSGSPAYPKGLQERAQVNAAMDWFLTNFHSAVGGQLAYPTLFPAMQPLGPESLEEVTALGRKSAHRWLKVLDEHMIGTTRNYVAGDELTIADYVGGSIAALAEGVDFDLFAYPNVCRWLSALKARPSWEPTYAAFYGLLTALKPAA
jgi:glutathione S-transferase